MTCEKCGHLMTADKNAARPYDFGGLPHVTLQGVVVASCPKCGAEEIGIPRIGQLHRVLAHQFIHQTRQLAAVEFRFLRKHMGLSTIDFARGMGVTRETVTRWETGAAPVSAMADRLVRLLVATHTPIADYAAINTLSEIDSSLPVPKRPPKFRLKASIDGWRPDKKLTAV